MPDLPDLESYRRLVLEHQVKGHFYEPFGSLLERCACGHVRWKSDRAD